MTENDSAPQTYERVSTYKDQQVTTVFDQKGRLVRVLAESSAAQPREASKLAEMIDHTLLKPDATASQIDQLCREALEFGFGAVCVNSYWVKQCKKMLAGSSVKTAATVGFPLGAMSTKAKVNEAKRTIKDGAVSTP